ncbi:MAG: carboxypeptidase regulatory-like domain-containing protein [Bryobacteraceae bacterium]
MPKTWQPQSHPPAPWLSLLVACLLAATVFATEHHGTVLFGGMPVPGATVTATKGDQRLVAITDEQGAYWFPDLADGIWTIQVEMLCFETIKREVAIQAGAPPPSWELKLLPPGQLHTVEQQAAPAPKTATPAEPAAASADGAKSAKGNGKKAQAPAEAQNGFQRTDLKASADAGSIAAEVPMPGDAQSSNDAFTVNGSMNNGAASPYAQSAAFGNGRKGPRSLYQAALNVTMDNSALDARTFSLTGQDTPKVAYNQLNGSASLGGPLLIPHVIPPSRQPAFFFLSYQWNRSRNSSNSPDLVPTESERGGDFSQAVSPLGVPLTIYDPKTGAPFPGNVIPQSRISPQAQALLAYYPLPNFASNTYNYQVPTPSTTSQDAVQARLNKALSMKNQFNGNFAWQHNNSGSTNAFGFLDNTHQSSLDVSPNWNHRFSNHVFSNLKFDFSRQTTLLTPYFANRENVSGNAGITGNLQDPLYWGPPSLSFSGSAIMGLSDATAKDTRNQTSALNFNTFWNHRSHNFNFGGDYRAQQFNYLSQSNPRGTFGFTGAATEAYSGGLAAANTGMDFADFLLGVPDTSQIAYGNADKYLRASFDDLYFNDDWRVRPGFSINAGLRREYSAPFTELRGRLVNLDVLPGFAAEVPVVAYDPTGSLTGRRYADSLVNPDRRGFEPRIAIAWHPFAASPLTIRAGYGLYFNTSIYQVIATQMYQQAPLSKSLAVANSAADPLTLANGFNASPNIATDSFGIDPNFRVGYAHNWQLVVQRDLPGSLVGVITYNGIKGTHAVQVFLPNTYPTGALDPCPACTAGYYYMASNGNSTREALILQLRRRLRNGFTASASYTYSKSIDDAALGGRGTGSTVIAQNWLDLSAERGPSGFDQRNLVTALVQYTTGMGVRGGTLSNGWKGEIWKNWTLSTQINAGTGLPETPTYALTVAGTGVTGPIRPSYTGLGVYDAPPGFYLNRAAFTAPAAGQWGTAGRDSIVGPNQFSLNTAMSRTFDEGKLNLIISTTNTLNHVTWTGWNAAVTSGQFGLPANANAMRRVQATLRFRF